VLGGEPWERDKVLSSPIILYDHPRVAPESQGDLFDATEIDEILTLRTQTLTDEERREASEGDPRVKALLDRTASVTQGAASRLHGALRRGPATFCAGERVRLAPRRRADVMDIALAGRLATVVSVEQDFEGRTYLAVTVDDDPGADLGVGGQPGHRFFFHDDEVERVP
jgi:hydrogenase maturation protease